MTSAEISAFTANCTEEPVYDNFAIYGDEQIMPLGTCSLAFHKQLTQLAGLTSQANRVGRECTERDREATLFVLALWSMTSPLVPYRCFWEDALREKTSQAGGGRSL